MKKREKLAIIRNYYPNAISTNDGINLLIDFVENQLDLDQNIIMMADSICSDDVNSIQYPANNFLGPFKMGGLDGFPFTGITGMGAFASHAPEDGAVIIYYGPHIGVSKNLAIGKIQRNGQSQLSGCCGAAVGALQKLMDDVIAPESINEMDYQMNTLEQILLASKPRIINAQIPLKEATEVIYEAIDKRIEALVSATNFKCKYLILMGATLINGDNDMGSFTSTRKFEYIDLQKNERTCIVSNFYPSLKWVN